MHIGEGDAAPKKMSPSPLFKKRLCTHALFFKEPLQGLKLIDLVINRIAWMSFKSATSGPNPIAPQIQCSWLDTAEPHAERAALGAVSDSTGNEIKIWKKIKNLR